MHAHRDCPHRRRGRYLLMKGIVVFWLPLAATLSAHSVVRPYLLLSHMRVFCESYYTTSRSHPSRNRCKFTIIIRLYWQWSQTLCNCYFPLLYLLQHDACYVGAMQYYSGTFG